jgi:hypothetical protein
LGISDAANEAVAFQAVHQAGDRGWVTRLMLGEVAHTPRIGEFDKELGLRSCDSDLPRGQLEMVAELIGHLEHQLDWAALTSVVHGPMPRPTKAALRI